MDPLTLILILLALIVAAVVAVLLVRTAQYPIDTPDPEPYPLTKIDGEEVAQHIGLAIQMKTINHVDVDKVDPIPFQGLHNLISTLYPEVEDHLKREIVGDFSLLYTWEGSDPSLDPIALTAHMDVVPANEAADSGWTYPPFSGTVADGYVWGRGAIDCKGVMIGILEAVSTLLKVGFEPKRTVYLAFGEDEEVSGTRGAAQIAKILKDRNVRLSFLLDEGGTIMEGSVPGIDKPVGLIGVAEKGHLSLVLKSQTAPGHASAPGETTSIGALALAIATLENNPFPQDLGMAEFMMSFLADELPFTEKLALANPWLFGGKIKKRFAADATTNAVTRTTIAPTIIHGGHTENVLPASAEATINLRLMPGDTLVDVYKHINELVGDETVKVMPAHEEQLYGDHSWDPTEISDVDSPQFHILLNLIKASVPGALAAPFLMTGATDARHYLQVSDRVFRFSPYLLTNEDVESVHGINERLSFENASRIVGFMIELIERLANLEVDTFEDLEVEEDEEDLDNDQQAIRELESPLPTRPMRHTILPEEEIVSETIEDLTEELVTDETSIILPEDEFLPEDEILKSSDLDPLDPDSWDPLPDDDEPLEVKPMN